MPDVPAGQRTLLSIWGNLQNAIRDPNLRSRPGGVVQYAWEAWKQSFIAIGESPPKTTIQDMNALLARAGQQLRAESSLQQSIATFQRTGENQAITGAHITPDIDSRSPADQPMGPNYRIRFDATYLVQGVAEQLTFTWEPGLQAPTDIASLMGDLGDAAAGFAEDYGTTFTGLGGFISITSV